MSGKIIKFQSHHELHQALCGEQVTQRGPARQAAVKRLITRISHLVQKLERTRSGEDSRLPLATYLASSQTKDDSGEVHPQPDVDHEILERIYGDLKYGVEAVARS